MTESLSPETVSGNAPLPGVGVCLRVAREARRLTIADVAETLKLGPRQVEALESGDWQSLPGQTFVRGFVRNYARLVQIDPAPLMEQLDATLEKPATSLNVPGSDQPSTPLPSSQFPRRDHKLVLLGLLIVGLAALAYLLLPGDLSVLRERTQGLIDSISRKEPAKEVPSTTAAPAPAASEPVFPPGTTAQQVMNPQAPAEMAPATLAAPAAAPAAVPAAGENAQLRFVFTRESWVEVRDRDNKVVYSQRSPAGAEQSIGGAGPLTLVIGYAPGVKLFWRGQAIDLAPHTKGEVARLVLE